MHTYISGDTIQQTEYKMRCIYCLENKDNSKFMRRDHIIPQCFGVFKNNLTLKEMVCDDCNQYFGDFIEIHLGRDSLEGIARYRFGINPRGNPAFKRLKLTLAKRGEMKGIHVEPLAPIQQINADEIKIVSQVGFYNTNINEYQYFSKNEIPKKTTLEKEGYDLVNKKIIFYGDVEELLKMLRKMDLNVHISEHHEIQINQEPSKVPVLIKARIDRTIYRGILKIAFNYLALHTSVDFALHDDFNGIRNFIRNDKGKSNEYIKIATDPILYKERIFKHRIYPGHFVLLEWNNFDLIAKISIYNSTVKLTYTVYLCRNFSGVWFPLNRGHYFDPISKTVSELFNPKFIILPMEFPR